MDRLFETVRQFLIQNSLTEHSGRFLVAVSGGPDSVCLLDVLCRLKNDLGLSLAVAHLNHNMRGQESENESRFVIELANQHGLDCFIETLEPDFLRKGKSSIQENARKARYEFLNRKLEEWGGGKIALGHHLDDQAETVLMNFLRGSGLRGLSGMAPVRGNLIRPLLDSPRSQIIFYLKERKVSSCEDSSNAKKDYLRNRVRADLIPLLHRDYNPNWKSHLAELASLFQEEDAYLEKTAVDLMDRELLRKSDVTHLSLCRSAFKQVPPALQYRIVREAYRRLQGHLRTLNWNHVRNAVRLACQARQIRQTFLPGNVLMVVDGYEIVFKKSLVLESTNTALLTDEYSITVPGLTLIPNGMEFQAQVFERDFPDWNQLAPHQVLFDLEKAGQDLKVRFFQNGDRFSPLGMKGSKKLKAFFIDRKIPRTLRKHIPLLTTASGDIIWVWREQISEKYRVRPESKRVCLITGNGEPFPDSTG